MDFRFLLQAGFRSWFGSTATICDELRRFWWLQGLGSGRFAVRFPGRFPGRFHAYFGCSTGLPEGVPAPPPACGGPGGWATFIGDRKLRYRPGVWAATTAGVRGPLDPFRAGPRSTPPGAEHEVSGRSRHFVAHPRGRTRGFRAILPFCCSTTGTRTLKQAQGGRKPGRNPKEKDKKSRTRGFRAIR